MFATYLFVQIVDQWHNIQSTIGISHLLKNANKPVVVRDTIIDELRSREDRNGLVNLPTKSEFFLGQRVRILTGQFAGWVALYDGMSSRQRERVLLDMLGQRVPVELRIGSGLEPV